MTTAEVKTDVCNLVKVGTLELEQEQEAEDEPKYRSLVVLNGDMLMVVDREASNLRLHRISDGQLLTKYNKLSSRPRDICVCVIKENDIQVAVGLWSGHIELLSVRFSDDVVTITSMKLFDLTKGFDQCYAVKYLKHKLLVSGRNGDIMRWGIVSFDDGHVDAIEEICKGKYGTSNLATNPKDDTMICISCYAGRDSADTGLYGYHIAVSTRREFLYKHRDLKDPKGVSMDRNGFIYICNKNPPSIHQLTERGEPVTVHREGMPKWLLAIYWDEQSGELYVTSYWSNVVTKLRPRYTHKPVDKIFIRDQSKFDIQKASAPEKIDSDNIKIQERTNYSHLLRKLEKSLKSIEKNAKFIVWLGTDLAKECMKVFVCVYQGEMSKHKQSYKGINIYYKDSEKPSRPIEPPHDMPTNSEFRIHHEDVELLQQAIGKHGLALFKQHSNLEAITGSSFTLSKSKGFIASASVVLYCQVKGIAPIGEVAFPATLTVGHISVKVDVREGYLKQGMLHCSEWCRTDWHENLRMGISIGLENCGAGTLGPFVRINDREIGFLTCAHVIEPEATNKFKLDESVGKMVFQPADGESHSANEKCRDERYCGKVTKIVFSPHICDPINGLPKDVGVDAALVRVTGKRDVDFRRFPFIPRQDLKNAGFDPDHPPMFEHGSIAKYPLQFKDVAGERVIKYGRTTGLTKGVLRLDGIMVMVQDAALRLPQTNKKVLMKGQYIIESVGGISFFAPGDSGSGVFILDKHNKLTCIGLAIGYLDPYQAVVTPIEYVLKSLDLTVDSMDFQDRTMAGILDSPISSISSGHSTEITRKRKSSMGPISYSTPPKKKKKEEKIKTSFIPTGTEPYHSALSTSNDISLKTMKNTESSTIFIATKTTNDSNIVPSTSFSQPNHRS